MTHIKQRRQQAWPGTGVERGAAVPRTWAAWGH